VPVLGFMTKKETCKFAADAFGIKAIEINNINELTYTSFFMEIYL